MSKRVPASSPRRKSSKFPKMEGARNLQKPKAEGISDTEKTKKAVKEEKRPDSPRVLEFVNMGASPRLDELSKERVRSHAMLEFNRRKSDPELSSESLERGVDSSGTGTNISQTGARGRFRLAGTKARPRKKSREPKELQKGQYGARQSLTGQPMHPVELHAPECVGGFEPGFKDAGNLTAPPIDLNLRQLHLGELHVHYPSSGVLNSFNALPVVLSGRKEVLVNHYRSQLLSSPLMNTVRAQWFNLAITDAALLHALLSHSAQNYASNQREERGDLKESLLLRTEAIRIINERIDSSDGGKLSDTTIGAVASLAGYEALYGSLDGIQTHIDGLEQMVKLRGGLASSGFSAPIQRLILWADLTSANALSTSPRFTPPDYMTSNELPNDDIAQAPDNIEHLHHPKYTGDSSGTLGRPALDYRLTSALRGLQKLTELLEASFDSNMPRTFRYNDVCYSDKIFSIERTLMRIAETSDGTLSCLDKCCSIAGLIYVNCCMRDVSPVSRGVRDLVSRLVLSLDYLKRQPQNLEAGQAYGHWLFWAIFIGAAAAKRSTADRSTAEQAKLLKGLGLVTGRFTHEPWSEIEKSLRRICWFERGGTLVGALLWEEIRTKKPGSFK